MEINKEPVTRSYCEMKCKYLLEDPYFHLSDPTTAEDKILRYLRQRRVAHSIRYVPKRDVYVAKIESRQHNFKIENSSETRCIAMALAFTGLAEYAGE